MKIALVTPWQNAWVPHYEQAFKKRGHEFGVFPKHAPTDSDIVLHGWATGTPAVNKARNIVFLRRYELFDGGLAKVDWAKTSDLICVNSWFKKVAETVFEAEQIKVPVHLIYNAVNLEKWTYAERRHGKRIGMACFVHTKKNLPLALQILAKLPKEYELHIAGAIQDACLAEYLVHASKALDRNVHLHGQVPGVHLDEWWDGMDYCLSTSLSEGNPNNVIEAMAKGLKPIVHNWPGAEDQFDKHLFNTVDEAVQMITEGGYRSEQYREEAGSKFGMSNIDRVVDLALHDKG
jgi:glycosyltransferase involved in cell wall biosynthesis